MSRLIAIKNQLEKLVDILIKNPMKAFRFIAKVVILVSLIMVSSSVNKSCDKNTDVKFALIEKNKETGNLEIGRFKVTTVVPPNIRNHKHILSVTYGPLDKSWHGLYGRKLGQLGGLDIFGTGSVGTRAAGSQWYVGAGILITF